MLLPLLVVLLPLPWSTAWIRAGSRSGLVVLNLTRLAGSCHRAFRLASTLSMLPSRETSSQRTDRQGTFRYAAARVRTAVGSRHSVYPSACRSSGARRDVQILWARLEAG